MENMSKEVKSELAQLRQGGWSLSGSLGADGTYFGDGDIFATKPNAENRPIKPESYDFVANLMYRLVEDCRGASNNGGGWNSHIVIDLTDGKTSIVVNSCTVDHEVTSHDWEEIKSRASVGVIEAVKCVIAKVNMVDDVKKIEVEYFGAGDSTDGVSFGFFDKDSQHIEQDRFPCEVMDDLEEIADSLVRCCGHDGYWNNEGGSGKIVLERDGAELITEYTHCDNIEGCETENHQTVCAEIVELLGKAASTTPP